MARTRTLENAFLRDLRGIHDAERQLSRALKRWAKWASAPLVRDSFVLHRSEADSHVARLEQAFALLGKKPRGGKCRGMTGIVSEAKASLTYGYDSTTQDAYLIAATRRAKRHASALNETLVSWAGPLRLREVAALLQQTIDEDVAADRRLASLARKVLARPRPSKADVSHTDDADDTTETIDTPKRRRRGRNGSHRQG